MGLWGAAFLGTLLAAAPASSADILKYVDDEGIVHFTDRVVTGKHEVFVKTRAHAPLPASLLREENQRRYLPLVHAAASRQGIDPEFVRCVIEAESGFNPRAVSRAGARGLMQLMPSTAIQYGVGNAFDPEENISGGTRYLKELLKKYRGNAKLALAAYNAGEDAVAKYKGIPPYRETRQYVARIMDRYGKTAALTDAVPHKRIFRYVTGDGSILLTDTPRQTEFD